MSPGLSRAAHSTLVRHLGTREAVAVLKGCGYAAVFWELPVAVREVPQLGGLELTRLALDAEDQDPSDADRIAELAEAVGALSLRVHAAPMVGRSYAQAYEQTVHICFAFNAAARRHGLPSCSTSLGAPSPPARRSCIVSWHSSILARLAASTTRAA